MNRLDSSYALNAMTIIHKDLCYHIHKMTYTAGFTG